MIGWLILGILALILAAAVLTPVQVRVTYDRDGLTVRAGYGPLHLQLYPRPAGEKEKTHPTKTGNPVASDCMGRGVIP